MPATQPTDSSVRPPPFFVTPPHPSLDAPPPLRGSDSDSFAHHSVVNRLPRILRQTMDETDFPTRTHAQLSALQAEIPHAPIRTFDDPPAPDTSDWNGYIEPRRSQDWLEVPWFFAETYFYRRIVAATGYFEAPSPERDPFRPQKAEGLASSREAIAALSRRLVPAFDQDTPAVKPIVRAQTLSLWGNRADLSLWPAGSDADRTTAPADAHILADNRRAAAEWIVDHAPLGRIDVVLDNAGFELVSDLALIAVLLETNAAASMHLHVKAHPTFVSDAVVMDVNETIRALAEADDPDTRSLGTRLRTHQADGRLTLTDPIFWTSPLPGWMMPDSLARTLGASDLVISKGDANYRRLLGDRHWPPTAPFARIVEYLPTRLLALRTLKSELAAGIDAATAEETASNDPDWLIDGEWGVIQFAGV